MKKNGIVDSVVAASCGNGSGNISLTCNDQYKFTEDIGFAKGVLELLYGNMTSEVSFMDLSTDCVGVVVFEARNRLEDILNTIAKKVGEVQA